MIHELKCWPVFFEAVKRGDKRFEVRKEDDKLFSNGDFLHLREWQPPIPDIEQCNVGQTGYTGRHKIVEVTHVLKAHEGLVPGYVVMGIKVLS